MKYIIVNIMDLINLDVRGCFELIKSLKLRLYISDFAIADCSTEEIDLVQELIEENILKIEKLDSNEIIQIYKDYVIEDLSIKDIASVFLCVKLNGVLISNDSFLKNVILRNYFIEVENIDYFLNKLKMKKAA